MKSVSTILLGGLLVIAGCSAEPPQEGVFIQNATLIDGTGAAPQTGANIWIRKNQIEAIGTDLEPPRGATVIDATGKFVVPGLIDAHFHLDAPIAYQISPEEREQIIEHNGNALLYNGVTTVLNVSSDEEWIWARRAAQREGRLISPRIYAMGRAFIPEGGWGNHLGRTLKDAEAARQRALDYVAKGTDGFKVVIEDGMADRSGTVPVMPDDMLEAIVEVAEAEDVPIYVHAINLEEYRKAVSIRPRGIVHGLEDPIPEGDPILQEMVDNDIIIIPTVSLFEAFLRYDERPDGFDDPILVGSVPTFLLERMRRADFMAEENARFRQIAGEDIYQWVAEKIPVFKENVTKMHQAGVKLAVGTDGGGRVGYNFQGYNTPWEVQLFVECGLSPMEALVAATRIGAKAIGVEDKLGTVEAGKWADPLKDIRNIREIDLIIRDGQVHSRSDFAYRSGV